MRDPWKSLAVFAALQATFSDVHPFCDQIVQRSDDAKNKGMYGRHRVWPDGVPVGAETDDRTGQPSMTASQLGRRCAARHVASYTLGQVGLAWVVTRALGYRLPPSALLAGAAINGVTHFVIDRREPLKRVLRSRLFNKGGYLDHATVQRRPGVVDEGGPGTALMECDQAAHRLIGVAASLAATLVAVRRTRR